MVRRQLTRTGNLGKGKLGKRAEEEHGGGMRVDMRRRGIYSVENKQNARFSNTLLRFTSEKESGRTDVERQPFLVWVILTVTKVNVTSMLFL